jgi:hypothetical protein
MPAVAFEPPFALVNGDDADAPKANVPAAQASPFGVTRHVSKTLH